jgi:hypothetical protein
MKFAFYKGKGTLIDKMIRVATLGKYSHCELIFSDGRWFSADAWENKCRYKPESEFNPNNWDFIDFHCDEALAKMFCDNIEGSEYDFRAIATWFLPDFRDDRSRWYCSEVGHEAVAFPRKRISPSALAKKLVNIST